MPGTYISDYMWSEISPLLQQEWGGNERPCNPRRHIPGGIIWRFKGELRSGICLKNLAPEKQFCQLHQMES